MANKNIYCTLDTETLGGAAKPEGIYHIGGLIHDRMGNVLASFNYIVAEHFANIDAAFYGKKNIDKYADMIREGTATMIPTESDAINAVDSLCNYFGVRVMMAFNSGFDFCKTAASALLNGREFIDLYLMAHQCLVNRVKYPTFCRENELFSRSKKSIATSAEAFYAYITNDPTYEEEHTALEDAKIEMMIFVACIKTHKPFTKNYHHYDYTHSVQWLAFPPVTV